MPDNFSFSPGSGAEGAAKNISGVLYPKVIATESDGSDTALAAKLGALTETAPTTDTASSGHNGRLQRIAQRITSLIALLPTALGAGGGLKVDGSGTALPVSGTVTANIGTSSLALETGGNLATIAGAVSSSKVAVKAASGDLADGAIATIGTKADAKNSATDTTAVSAMSVWKQISASVQAIATSVAGSLTVATHAVTQSGTWNVTVNAAIAAGTNLLGKMGIDQTTPGTTNAVSIAQLGSTTVATGNGTSSAGALRVAVASDNTPFGVVPSPATSGGPTVARIKAAASTNATSIKASAGQIYAWALFNNTTTARYVKIYNKASSPTVGTDTPAFTIIVPGATGGSGTNIEFSMGIPLGTGIAYAITEGIADSDTTSCAADDVHGVLLYK